MLARFDPVLLTQVALVVTAALAGLSWTIQLVHYPLFRRVGAAEWIGYHSEHVKRITPLVGPLMVGELVLSIGLAVLAWPANRMIAVTMVLSLVAIWWLTRMAVLVHEALAGRAAVRRGGRSLLDRDQLIGMLLRVDLGRSLLWTGRVVLLFWWLRLGAPG
ncbi:MAG: hypothetical protein AB7L66_13125 [Gemmatimonadales bacterium]